MQLSYHYKFNFHIHYKFNFHIDKTYSHKKLFFRDSINHIFKKMENEILQAIKHIKDISRKKVTLGKIEAFTKKNNIKISTDEPNNIIENMVTNGSIIKKGDNRHASYSYPEQSEVSEEVADITEISQRKETKEDLEQGFEETQIIPEEDTS